MKKNPLRIRVERLWERRAVSGCGHRSDRLVVHLFHLACGVQRQVAPLPGGHGDRRFADERKRADAGNREPFRPCKRLRNRDAHSNPRERTRPNVGNNPYEILETRPSLVQRLVQKQECCFFGVSLYESTLLAEHLELAGIVFPDHADGDSGAAGGQNEERLHEVFPPAMETRRWPSVRTSIRTRIASSGNASKFLSGHSTRTACVSKYSWSPRSSTCSGRSSR